jgi:hypothetical protein
MSYAERHSLTLTTDASGDATGYIPVAYGKLSQIRYVKTDYADGVVFAIIAESTGETLWSETAVNASKTVAPRQPTHDTLGDVALYSGDGQAVLDKIAIAQDRVKIVVSSGGDKKSGTFHVVVE